MKLSTGKIKEMMKEWFAKPSFSDENFVIYEEEDPTQKQILIEKWTNPKYWRRNSKERLKYTCFKSMDYSTHLYQAHYSIDYDSWFDPALVQFMFENEKIAEKCWVRIFCPAEEFSDNYYLEVITTPEDDKIIAWNVSVD